MPKYINSNVHPKVNIKAFAAFLLAFFIVFQFSFSSFAAPLDNQKEQEVKERLKEILSSEEFTYAGNEEGLLKKFADWLKEKVEKLTRNIKIPERKSAVKPNTRIPQVSPEMVKAIVIIVIIIFFGVLLYFIFKNLKLPERLKKEAEDAELLSVLKDPDSVESKALELCSRGEFKQGFRLLYIALLLKLNERDLIKIDKSKTNRQYMKELRNSGFSMYEIAEGFTAAFNEYWYGNGKVGRENFDYWYDRYTSIVKEGNG